MYKEYFEHEITYRIILSGRPQRLSLGPIIFIILIVDLFLTFKEAEVANFAQNNTVCRKQRCQQFFKALKEKAKLFK